MLTKGKTLAEMLENRVYLGNLIVVEDAQAVFKEWLREVGLPVYSTPEDVRKMLITLVDES